MVQMPGITPAQLASVASNSCTKYSPTSLRTHSSKRVQRNSPHCSGETEKSQEEQSQSQSNGSDSSDGSDSSSSHNDPSTTTSDKKDTGNYKDGNYSINGQYGPVGEDSIDVHLTIKDGNVETVNIIGHPFTTISKNHQDDFAKAINGVVDGKPLKGLKVDKVAGASWTSDAFNKALEVARQEASIQE
mgnify:CR=1 FL=1